MATVVAVMTYTKTMTRDINHKLEKFGANILILPRTEALPLTYGGVSLGGVSFDMEPIHYNELASIKTIKNAENIAAVGPVVLGKVAIQGKPVLLAGMDFKVSSILKPWWRVNGGLPKTGGLLAGAEAAGKLKLQIGNRVHLADRTLIVKGILEPTGSQDDHLVFTDLETAQQILGKDGEISLVEVAALCKDCPVDDMVVQIGEKMPSTKVMAIQQVVRGRMETLAHFRKFSYGLSIVVVLIGGLVVLVTLMGSVRERTREIGIFRAVGFRKSQVMKIIFLETGVISLLAGVSGYAAGLVAVRVGLLLAENRQPSLPPLDPGLMLWAIAMAGVVGMAASIYPASVAARMDPNQALAAL